MLKFFYRIIIYKTKYEAQQAKRASQSAFPTGTQMGPRWATNWVPVGLPNWDPAKFGHGLHLGPSWANPCGL